MLFGCFVKDVAARGLDLPQVTWIVQVLDFFRLYHIMLANIFANSVYYSRTVHYAVPCWGVLRRSKFCRLVCMQFNPPTSAAEYVHRVGRTARIGAQGNGLLFLTPSETAYMDVLANHNIRSVIKLNYIKSVLLVLYKRQHFRVTVWQMDLSL